jgi:hypothetical protein
MTSLLQSIITPPFLLHSLGQASGLESASQESAGCMLCKSLLGACYAWNRLLPLVESTSPDQRFSHTTVHLPHQTKDYVAASKD